MYPSVPTTNSPKISDKAKRLLSTERGTVNSPLTTGTGVLSGFIVLIMEIGDCRFGEDFRHHSLFQQLLNLVVFRLVRLAALAAQRLRLGLDVLHPRFLGLGGYS